MNNTINETLNQTINSALNQTTQDIPEILGQTVPLTSYVFLDIFLIALVGSLFVTIVNKYLSDQEKIKQLKKEMNDLRKKSREALKKDPKQAQKIQQEMMQKSMENMKHTMNPKIMLTTMLPMLLILGFVRKYYSAIYFPVVLNLGFTQFTWLGTYICSSIIWSIILKKILDVA